MSLMSDHQAAVAPESTAARVAMWRALHVQIDPPPHVLDDEIGLKLLAPDQDWRRRGDMDPEFTRPFRASIVARARFIEDLVVDQAGRGVTQYVILGAGLDSFGQRRPEIASRIRIFEIDQPGPQAWKRQRRIASASAFQTGCTSCRSISRRAAPVSQQGGECGHLGPGRRARPGIDARHDIPVPAGAGGP
jgi:O-methyltransferase involved in polyketide biosynthesis